MSPMVSIPCVHYSFNPWWGCTRLSAGCDRCYAATLDAKVGGDHWGPEAPRRTFGEKYWAQPLRWDAVAATIGVNARVLCASMADVFDVNAPAGQLERLWALIRHTPHLDWLLLTRRPGRIARSLPSDWGEGYRNAWLGVSVEDAQAARQRVPVLAEVPAWRRFVCCEPMLGPVDLRPWAHALDWVIAGGETGPGARPMHPDWIRGLRDQCQEADLPFFFKAWGEYLPEESVSAYAARRRRVVGPETPGFENGPRLYHVGRERAGRRLDGHIWQQLPRGGPVTPALSEERGGEEAPHP